VALDEFVGGGAAATTLPFLVRGAGRSRRFKSRAKSHTGYHRRRTSRTASAAPRSRTEWQLESLCAGRGGGAPHWFLWSARRRGDLGRGCTNSGAEEGLAHRVGGDPPMASVSRWRCARPDGAMDQGRGGSTEPFIAKAPWTSIAGDRMVLDDRLDAGRSRWPMCTRGRRGPRGLRRRHAPKASSLRHGAAPIRRTPLVLHAAAWPSWARCLPDKEPRGHREAGDSARCRALMVSIAVEAGRGGARTGEAADAWSRR
jgi:hypothetical protein